MDIFNEIFNTDCYKEYESIRGIQNVYTPIDKIEEATAFEFNSVIDSSTKEVAVLFNFEFIENIIKKVNKDYINNIHITFFYDSNFDLNEAKFICACNNFNNITFESIKDFSDSKNIKDLEKVMANKKFDIVFSNPPYNKNLDLKILNSLFEFSINVIFIHPAGFLFDKKNIYSLYTKIKNTLFLNKTILFWGNELFNIGLYVPLCISIWNTNKKIDICEVYDYACNNKKYKCNINDISYLSLDVYKFLTSLKYDSIYNHKVKADYSDLTDYAVKCCWLRGHAGNTNKLSDDFFTMITKTSSENFVNSSFRYSEKTEEKSNAHFLLWAFSTNNERINFVNYLKSKIARIFLATRKMNQHLDSTEIYNIPWLDFTQEWNDAKLCKKFGISKELWNYIDNFIPDYYDDYKSGF